MYVKPAPGLIVRDPVTKFPLPAAGREVQLTSYWLRRVAAGDVELTEAPVAVSEAMPEDPYHLGPDENPEP